MGDLAIDLGRLRADIEGLEVEELMRAEPVRMAPRVQAAIEAEAGMIFVPSQGGRSHRPDEWSDWEAIERGANVLLGTLLRLVAPGA